MVYLLVSEREKKVVANTCKAFLTLESERINSDRIQKVHIKLVS